MSQLDADASSLSHPSRFFTLESPPYAPMNLFFLRFTVDG
ncbi:hypothetical protein KR50_00770 [Jeotgalibacillus campisalis]|uniref:Uncharacterized protein n=1 Tax=Jeotgalibacillus campisalis TaxID=220754 RepID=A0A0C2W9M3_9BACL|nr:hypothetical protein KR50_00770 [Jeotgalibacillus campisalis]